MLEVAPRPSSPAALRIEALGEVVCGHGRAGTAAERRVLFRYRSVTRVASHALSFQLSN